MVKVMHVAQRLLAQSTGFDLVLPTVRTPRKSRVIAVSHEDDDCKGDATFRRERYLESTGEVKD